MEYRHIGELTPDGTVYVNDDMGPLEAMVPPGKYATAHAPALLELENGDMLCAWFAGSFEGSKDISIVCARKENGSDHWEEPVAVSYDTERSEQNPSLFPGPDGACTPRSWIVWKEKITCSLLPLSAARDRLMVEKPGERQM